MLRRCPKYLFSKFNELQKSKRALPDDHSGHEIVPTTFWKLFAATTLPSLYYLYDQFDQDTNKQQYQNNIYSLLDQSTLILSACAGAVFMSRATKLQAALLSFVPMLSFTGCTISYLSYQSLYSFWYMIPTTGLLIWGIQMSTTENKMVPASLYKFGSRGVLVGLGICLMSAGFQTIKISKATQIQLRLQELQQMSDSLK